MIVGAITSWQVLNGPYMVQHLAAEGANGNLLNFYWSPQHDWQVVNVSQKTGINVSSSATSWQTPYHCPLKLASGHILQRNGYKWV